MVISYKTNQNTAHQTPTNKHRKHITKPTEKTATHKTDNKNKHKTKQHITYNNIPCKQNHKPTQTNTNNNKTNYKQ